jgi:GNAT superfamily N-acetyltransferase
MDQQYYIDCIREGKRLYTEMLGRARGLRLHAGDIGWLESDPHGGPEYIFDIDVLSPDAEQCVLDMIELIKQGAMPRYILISTISKPDNLVEIFRSRGFTVNLDDGSGMAMDLPNSLSGYQAPNPLSVLPVRDESSLATWVEIVNTALFGGELITYEQYYDMYKLKHVAMNLGFVGDTPAATALVIYSDKTRVATVEQISTLEEYRCKGLGTAITMASLQQMYNRGVQTAVLHATKAGERIYRKIGFIDYFGVIEAIYPRGVD